MKKISVLVSVLGLVLVSVGFSCQQSAENAETKESEIKVVVYKSASCGCCGLWIQHLEEEGFEVESHNVLNVNAIKSRYGVRNEYSSCHTAFVDGYVVEGHVPADQIKRLLAERPKVSGLAVPAMPLGSPGMEVPNRADYQDYDVLAFDASGRTAVFASIPASAGRPYIQ